MLDNWPDGLMKWPPEDWKVHPTSPVYVYRGQECIHEEALYVRVRPSKRGRAEMLSTIKLRQAIYLLLKETNPQSVRQVYYQMASVQQLVTKDKTGLQQVEINVRKLREQDIVPWEWISDGTRLVHGGTDYDSGDPDPMDEIESALSYLGSRHHRGIWKDEEIQVQVWCEKDALTSVLDPICQEYNVPLLVTRGFSSLTYIFEAAKAIVSNGKKLVALHIGDYDPSGQLAEDKIEERIIEFVNKMASNLEIEFWEVAVTAKQIEELNLPTRPTKDSGHKDASWDGKDSCEVDAIPMRQLQEILRGELRYYMPDEKVAKIKEKQEREREHLRKWGEWALKVVEKAVDSLPEDQKPKKPESADDSDA